MFDARDEAKNLDTRPFPFVGMDGESYELPPAGSITAAQAERLQDGDESVMTELIDEAANAALQDMPLEVVNRLMAGWLGSLSDLGKQGGSAQPPRRQRRAKR